MIKKIAIGGLVAAAIVGVGTAALAETGSSRSATAGAASAVTSGQLSTGKMGGGKAERLLAGLARRVVHGQFVTKGKDSTYVTHNVIRGTVTSVSATSITVLASDKVSEKFTVDGDTKVRVRTNGSGSAGTIAQVKSGDTVLVAGTGTGTPTANFVIDSQK